MTAEILNFTGSGGNKWPEIRAELVDFLRQCGADELLIATVCERMRQHHVNCGLDETFVSPEMPIECRPSLDAALIFIKRANAKLFSELLTLEVFIYQHLPGEPR
jgi:hypothetical protein